MIDAHTSTNPIPRVRVKRSPKNRAITLPEMGIINLYIDNLLIAIYWVHQYQMPKGIAEANANTIKMPKAFHVQAKEERLPPIASPVRQRAVEPITRFQPVITKELRPDAIFFPIIVAMANTNPWISM